MSSDPSPWIRSSLQRSFGRLLAVVAIGDHLKAHHAEITEDLVIENDLDAAKQQAQPARKRLVDAAVAALKEEVGDNDNLKRSLWAAVNSTILPIHEIQAMLDICKMLYEPIDSLIFKIRYPRYWKVEYLGKGKLKFTHTERVRTKPYVKWVPRAPPHLKKYDLLPPKSSVPKISFKSSAPPPPPRPSTPGDFPAGEGPGGTRPTLKLKISMPRPSAG